MITDIVIVVAAALLAGVYVSWRAGRIDRLHARVDMARAALDATLLRRASVALELATSGLLDPATSLLLATAAHGARQGEAGGMGSAGPGDRPQPGNFNFATQRTKRQPSIATASMNLPIQQPRC